ncbi:hypothetical protein ACMFMG_007214 [Clarireedia jacksonii]
MTSTVVMVEQQELQDRNEALPSPLSLITPLLDPIKITKVYKEDEYSYYGPMPSDLMIQEASVFVSNNSDAIKLHVESILREFIRLTREDCKSECKIEPKACWFTVRMFKPNDEYTTPRWHRDGRMTDCTSASHLLHCKYATVLLGAPTLVLPETKTVATIDNRPIRRKENAKLLSSEVPVRLVDGQIIRFSWGRNDSPVHSEPNMISDRIFLSVLYGSESEMRDMVELRRHYGSPDVYRSCERRSMTPFSR